jgi:hypothetical protein
LALVAVVAVALTGAVASANSHRRRPGCGRSCRQLGGLGGTMGACLQDAYYMGNASVSDSQVLKIKIKAEYPSTGDLMLAAVTSTNGVKPPHGWLTNSTLSGTTGGQRQTVQVFYRFAGERTASSFSFTSAAPQPISGALIAAMGVSHSQPFDYNSTAATIGPPSRTVTAPSISATATDSLILFVGTAGKRVKWTAPSGMKALYLDSFGTPSSNRLGIATQRWRPAGATGGRKARISAPAPALGELVALHYPTPITCPRVKVLSHHFQPNRQGILSVKMSCDWTARCRAIFEGVDLEDHFPTPKIAASDFTIPAGKTRSVPIAMTRAGSRALRRHGRLRFDIYIWAYTSANQIVVAGTARSKIIAPGT